MLLERFRARIMSQFSPFWLKARSGANVSLDAMLFAFSVYAVPAAIAVVSLIALFTWDSPYSAETPAPLEFRVLEQTGASLEPGAALAALAAKPLAQFKD